MSGINSLSNNIQRMPQNCGMKGMHESANAKTMQHKDHPKTDHNEHMDKSTVQKPVAKAGSFDVRI
ncbi:MAG TPA: hypothetical protein VEG39_20175 [Clostridia bacterium]|nr:hypothetical protein [Clostridia bacterium]